MTQVFHGHQPRIVSRHHGKEQMLVRPDDLVAMLVDHRLDVQATCDADEVTLRVPAMGVLGFGETWRTRSTIYLMSFALMRLASSASRSGSWRRAEAPTPPPSFGSRSQRRMSIVACSGSSKRRRSPQSPPLVENTELARVPRVPEARRPGGGFDRACRPPV